MIFTEDGAAVDIEELRSARSFWYVASPYSKFPAGIDAAFEAVSRATARLVVELVPAFSPIAHSHPVAIHGGLDPFDHSVWMPFDEPMMNAAHGCIVVMMDGWRESYGIGLELERFRAAGKPIYFMPHGGGND